MYIFYGTTLIFLLLILCLLYREERYLRFGVSYGKLDRYLILRERRRYVRFKTDIPIYYKILQNATGILQNANAKDISKAGLGLVVYERLKVGELLEIDFKVPEFKKNVKAIGQVVWIKEIEDFKDEGEDRRVFRIGIKFKKIDTESEALLILYINQMKTSFSEALKGRAK